jgi:hypothetical protein
VLVVKGLLCIAHQKFQAKSLISLQMFVTGAVASGGFADTVQKSAIKW